MPREFHSAPFGLGDGVYFMTGTDAQQFNTWITGLRYLMLKAKAPTDAESPLPSRGGSNDSRSLAWLHKRARVYM